MDPEKDTKIELIEEEGWNAVMQHVCFILFWCASSSRRYGGEGHLDDLADDGWTATDIMKPRF